MLRRALPGSSSFMRSAMAMTRSMLRSGTSCFFAIGAPGNGRPYREVSGKVASLGGWRSCAQRSRPGAVHALDKANDEAEGGTEPDRGSARP